MFFVICDLSFGILYNFFMNFRKSIFTAASPNTQKDDVKRAVKMLLMPWKWYNEKYNTEFAKELKKYLSIEHVELVDSGRSALYTILKSLGIGPGDEVILPSFTCVVVANAIKWSGASPVYLDTSTSDFNANYEEIKHKITARTRAIIVQHTFGKMVDVDRIFKLLTVIDKKDTFVIEDFAHTLQRHMNIKGDVGFATFGIEKVISSVRGGAIFTNNKKINEAVRKTINEYKRFPDEKIFICLLNPIFWWFAIPLHSLGIGRFSVGALIRTIWRKLGFLGIMVEEKENRAEQPKWFPSKMAPALSYLGINQLGKLGYFNKHRRNIAKIYHEHLAQISDYKQIDFDEQRVYLRYPLLLETKAQKDMVWDLARSLRVTIGNWFAVPLYGSTVGSDTYEKLSYVPEHTPTTLKKCSLVLNLPTSVNIDMKRAKELAVEIERVLTT